MHIHNRHAYPSLWVDNNKGIAITKSYETLNSDTRPGHLLAVHVVAVIITILHLDISTTINSNWALQESLWFQEDMNVSLHENFLPIVSRNQVLKHDILQTRTLIYHLKMWYRSRQILCMSSPCTMKGIELKKKSAYTAAYIYILFLMSLYQLNMRRLCTLLCRIKTTTNSLWIIKYY